MIPDEIRVALETAVGVPREAIRAAIQQSVAFAPAVIEAAQSMIAGRLPLPHQERLLRFGMHALAAARETSACPAFLALLRRPGVELGWLFGEDRETLIARLLLGLFDGDEHAALKLIAEPGVDEDARSGLMRALAKLAWEGRVSRDGVLAMLDRFDDEALAPVDSFAWFGWQEAILLLGATDRIERVQRGWQAGRLTYAFQEVDRQDWLEQIRAAAEHPDDSQRFLKQQLVPLEEGDESLDWSADAPRGPNDALSDDELAWLDIALMRTTPDNRSLEESDGLLTALAAGPVRAAPDEYLREILRAPGETSGLDSPEHKALVIDLLKRHHAALERDLASDKARAAWAYDEVPDLRGVLWARGYLDGTAMHKRAWEPLYHDRRLVETLLVPLLALMPDPEVGVELSYARRSELLRALPEIATATKAYWSGDWHPLLAAPVTRTAKIGRNDPCPCGSHRKFKRCCAAVA
jgi:yecA family protein